MKENYINIFTAFLAKLLEEEKLDLEDAAGLVKVFQPVAPMMQSRQQLISFLEFYIKDYPQLETLKQQLADLSHKFDNPQ